MKKIDVPLLGSPKRVAEYIQEVARNEHQTVETEYNGTPMWASISCSVDQIVMRWHYERLLIQIANGIVQARTYADPRYVK